MLSNLSVICPMEGSLRAEHNRQSERHQGHAGNPSANFQEMNLMLRVDEIDVPKVQEGQQAQVMVWREGQQEVAAVVSKIGASGGWDGYCRST